VAATARNVDSIPVLSSALGSLLSYPTVALAGGSRGISVHDQPSQCIRLQ
jgi:hypothetical protein